MDLLTCQAEGMATNRWYNHDFIRTYPSFGHYYQKAQANCDSVGCMEDKDHCCSYWLICVADVSPARGKKGEMPENGQEDDDLQ